MTAIRNIAIIAHVDHGKTTLVDKIIQECKALDERKESSDLVLDNNDLERERGITILSKNVSVTYKGVKINIIDTPGHSDFGGEVERVLKMADGVLLLVDAFEGPMPQTRFVLSKAIELSLKPIVVVNKVDKDNCRPDEVHEQVYELMFNLEANDDQLNFATIYGSSKHGWMSTDWKKPTTNLTALLDAVLENIPQAPFREGPLQMQIASLDHSPFTGRIAIGRIFRGTISEGQTIALCTKDNAPKKMRVKELYVFHGLGKTRVKEAGSGDICAVVGLEGFEIGDTIADADQPEALTRIAVDEPTMSMLFTINTSPFFGREGKFVTSRQLRDRLYRETEKNLALRIEDTNSEDTFNVFGRGILHLSILVETMRREGYELQLGKPRVITREIDGKKHEPYETLVIDTPAESAGKAIEIATQRKGELLVMEPKGDLQHLEFAIPSRGLIGLRSQLMTASQGEAIITHRFEKFGPWKGDLGERRKGAMVSGDTGQALAYAIDRLQDRGVFFIDPNEEVYKGQVIGENSREGDLEVNVIKGKKLTNVRASGADDAAKIAPKRQYSLEESMEYIAEDEYLEITPQSIRMRKIPHMWKR